MTADRPMIYLDDAIAAVRSLYDEDVVNDYADGKRSGICSALNALRALPAVAPAVRVKPLVWCYEQEGVQVVYTSAWHQYRIVFDGRASSGAWMWFCDGKWLGCETEDAAKAAAQADYEARILAALVYRPGCGRG